MSNFLPVRGGSLSRRLAVPLSLFVLVASLVMVVWTARLYRDDSLQRFERMAVTNADFVDELPLPRSAEMAARLATILDVGVGFYVPGGTLASEPEDAGPENLTAILEHLADGEPAVVSEQGFDIAVAPLAGSDHHLVLVRPRAGGLAGIGGWVLAPAIGLTIACGGLVLLLAHRIVRPLAILTRWLPNLEHDPEPAEPVPATVSGRRDEIGRLARALEQTHERLRQEQERRRQSERMAALGQIATRLAHEVRNPAAAIRMHADLLARADANPQSSEAIGLIRAEVDRITDLVNQWLFVVRAAPPETKPHELGELVRNVAERLQPALDHSGARLVTRLAPHAEVDCDRLRIEQVIRNLVTNAVQAMPQGGEITISVEPRDDRVELVVRDTGTGFSDEALRRFGEPFFSEREGGMGIGLTLAREVIQAHGGKVTATNTPKGGAEIRVSLPRHHPSNHSL